MTNFILKVFPNPTMNNVLHPLMSFGLTSENTLLRYLIPEPADPEKQFIPRQVYRAHYTTVKTEKVPHPYFIAASPSCAISIGLNPSEISNPKFVDIFSGNEMAPGLDVPYCTLYGCHCYGQWFGQLGDGRAMGIGEVLSYAQGSDIRNRYELQLKGCGRSPYSRGFDGRAVLRSCVREFLVSEAMHHLRVPTTRALSIIGTGMEIRRPWYDVSATDRLSNMSDDIEKRINFNDEKYSPDTLIREPGAVLCRVSKSFLRVSQLEIFAKRNEGKELIQLADYVCFREFPQLLSYTIDNIDLNIDLDYKDISRGSPERYVEMYKEIIKGNAYLVTEWLRVGYVQGNMNSDNTLLAGRTIDYGPYGWLEQYNPSYQPFTSDSDGKFSYINQPTAMNINMIVLGKSIEVLIIELFNQYTILSQSKDLHIYIQQIRDLSQKAFQQYFSNFYNDMRLKKLGLALNREFKPSDDQLWIDLERLLFKTKSDHTIFFRELSKTVHLSPSDTSTAVDLITSAFYQTPIENSLRSEFETWFEKYLLLLQESGRNPETIKDEMNQYNPKYVLRNWMAVLAYEKAQEGDNSLIEELHNLLLNPYDEQSTEAEKKWFKKTPLWARNMPGSSFMS